MGVIDFAADLLRSWGAAIQFWFAIDCSLRYHRLRVKL
jgi:hypothetical protein